LRKKIVRKVKIQVNFSWAREFLAEMFKLFFGIFFYIIKI